MNRRDIFEVGLRLLAIFLVIEGLATAAKAFGDYRLLSGMATSSSTYETVLPALVAPVIRFFGGLYLWLTAQALSLKAFPGISTEINHQVLTVAKSVGLHLLGIYLIVVGFGGMIGFASGQVIPPIHEYQYFFVYGPYTWNDFAQSLTHFLAGILLRYGINPARGLRKAGNAVADDLWRIKPEGDEPETKS